jgi:hypothetical protein
MAHSPTSFPSPLGPVSDWLYIQVIQVWQHAINWAWGLSRFLQLLQACSDHYLQIHSVHDLLCCTTENCCNTITFLHYCAFFSQNS